MLKNVGTIDRVLRFVIGAVFIAYALNMISPDTGYNSYGWLGVILVLTAAFKFCPVYRIFGIQTCKKTEEE